VIRVGFTIVDGKINWMGGINYLRNLLYAISTIENKEIQPVLFLGKQAGKKLVDEFKDLAEIQQDELFDRFSTKWIRYTFTRDILRRNPLINQIISKHNIQVFSHSYIYGPDIKCRTTNWIPDFQHMYLPQLYSKLHLLVRDYRLRSVAKYSDVVILSSYASLADFKKFTPDYVQKARVMHFVSQCAPHEQKNPDYLCEKYNFIGEYFFLPNQFWAHKNHKIAFEAIKLAKTIYPDILLICSGSLDDNRNIKHILKLKSFIQDNNLGDNIKLLGLIPFNDVLLLMQHSIAIINPSYFEGWSSTVEESKSMQKSLILSDIPVHREQAPADGEFFDPDNALQLKEILTNKLKFVEERISNPNNYNLKEQTIDFGERFQSIIMETYLHEQKTI